MELSVQELACSRGGIRVLDGVSFTLGPGQALVLRGPNGSGKTTLLRTLAGLQPAEGGRVEAPPGAIAYAGHADGIKPTLTVRENLAFWASLYRSDLLPEALAAFDLGDLAERAAQNLSAGQKRRLGLARLIVTGRPVWILDEPTVSLDATATSIFARTVRAHLAEGGIAVIATHIDLGLPEAEVLDLAPFRARAATPDAPRGAFDEAVE